VCAAFNSHFVSHAFEAECYSSIISSIPRACSRFLRHSLISFFTSFFPTGNIFILQRACKQRRVAIVAFIADYHEASRFSRHRNKGVIQPSIEYQRINRQSGVYLPSFIDSPSSSRATPTGRTVYRLDCPRTAARRYREVGITITTPERPDCPAPQ